MNLRRKRNLLLQKLFWNSIGFQILRLYIKLRRRIDYVLLNHSLDSETNGEYWLLDNLPKEATVIDVGFNMGDYTRQVLKRCLGARVYAFDPAKAIHRFYQANYADNSQVEFFPIALSNESGELEFYDYNNECSSLTRRTDAGPEKESYIVPVKTLDQWTEEMELEQIDLLKVDAEGFDANVLEGAISLLASKKVGAVMFEYASGWVGNRRFLGDVAKLVEPTEYRMFQLFNGFFVPFDYDVSHESTLGRMFILLPPSSWATSLRVCPNAQID